MSPRIALSLTAAAALHLGAPTQPRGEYTFTERPGVLDSIHPDYSLVSLLPEGIPNKVIGLDWLPNGDMAILTMQDSMWPESGGGHGWVHLLTGARSAPASTPTLRTVYYGFLHPMGLAVANGAIHVSQRESLVRLLDGNADGTIDSLVVLANYPDAKLEDGWGRWAMNLQYRDGTFYTGLGAYHFVHGDGPCLPSADRGVVHTVNAQGQMQNWGSGLREPNGIGFGPDGELFATDNDGEWVAANRLVHVRKNAFYGLVTCKTWDASLTHTLPAIWFPKHLRSPGQPLLLTQGTFAGQMVVGDYVVRNLSRIFLEKVNDSYQGALFPMSGGLASGGLRLLADDDGALYVGEITIENHEGWWISGIERPAPGALEKLIPKSSTAFEMLALRAQRQGMEIEFTRPAATTAADPASYLVRQWRLESTWGYGSPKIDSQVLAVTEAKLSADGRKVALTLPGLKAGHIVHVQLRDDFRGVDGQSPWAYEGWYTLNAIPGVAGLGHDANQLVQNRPRIPKVTFRRLSTNQGTLAVTMEGQGLLQLFDSKGRSTLTTRIANQQEIALPEPIKSGFYLVRIRTSDGRDHRLGIPLF
jgi:hypothetical protein